MRKLELALVGAIFLALAPTAVADEYEVFIDIETEEDLYDLLAEQQISEDTFNTLLLLFQRGVDLNKATREELYSLPNLTYAEVDAILTYREEIGHIADPAALVVNRIISDRKLLGIAAFLRISDVRRPMYATDGLIRSQARWSNEDDRVPPMALLARVASLKHLQVGAAGMLTRNRLGDVVYDPNRDALSAEAPGNQLHVPKFYAYWDTDDYGIVAGTYRIGFGQRLTFDNTDQITPNGIYPDDELYRDTYLTRECKESAGELPDSPCAGDASYVYVTPDFRWSEGLTGAAAGLKHLEVGPGTVQTYGFLSLQPRSIYQYEIYDKEICEDPQDDEDPNCSAPYVFNQQEDPLAPTSRFSFHTLPNLYRETIAGANATFFADRRTHFGLTGYHASIAWLPTGIDLDFQEWSRTPYGGPFGALGFDLAWGRHWVDVFAEVAHSFDSMEDGGGGLGALVRGVATWDKNEVETSLRYYDTNFANPHARPISQPDEHDGLRARDEVGGRVRYSGMLQKRFNLRALADMWMQPSDDLFKTQLRVRGDIDVTKQFRWGLWAEFQDKGFGEGGRGQCYEISMEEDERGEPIPCAGKKLQLTGRLRYAPTKGWSLAGQLQHETLDDYRYDDKFRQDVSAWLILRTKPADSFRITARTRYLFEDISDNEYLEQSWWTYVDFTYQLPQRYRLRVRYDLVVYLDDRDRTELRVPAPENWLWLELEAKF